MDRSGGSYPPSRRFESSRRHQITKEEKVAIIKLKEMGKKKSSSEYDRIYGETGELFKKYNPCQFIDGKCMHNRNEDKENGGWKHEDGCCPKGCRHHTSEGCSTEALGCKLTTCGSMYCSSTEEFRNNIDDLKKEAVEIFGWEVTTAYTNKEEFLRGEIKH